MEYSSQEELFYSLRGAFNVKLRLIGDKYNYLRAVDIWNYLKITKWSKGKNLSISEMVNDIITAPESQIDLFFKKNIINEERKIYTE